MSYSFCFLCFLSFGLSCSCGVDVTAPSVLTVLIYCRLHQTCLLQSRSLGVCVCERGRVQHECLCIPTSYWPHSNAMGISSMGRLLDSTSLYLSLACLVHEYHATSVLIKAKDMQLSKWTPQGTITDV